MLTEEAMKTIHDEMVNFRLEGDELNRFGLVDEEGCIFWSENDGACYGSLTYRPNDLKRARYLFACWNGESVESERSRRYGTDRQYVYNVKKEFHPGPISDRWLVFLMGDQSPWKAIQKYFVVTDQAIIRESGFVIDVQECPFNLLYNFLIATRMTYEYPRRARIWVRLQDEYGVDPVTAFLISTTFYTRKKVEEVVLEAGHFKKDPEDRRRNLRDENGNPIWVPAVTKLVVDDEEETFGMLSPCGHSPLPSMFGYCRKVLALDPKVDMERPFHRGRMGQAWDIFLTEKDTASRQERAELEGANLPTILEYINKFR